MKLTLVFILSILPCILLAFPASDTATESLLVVNKQPGNPDNVTATETVNNESLPPQLKSMNVTSHIRNRYARTMVTSRYMNTRSTAQEATFSIVLPNTAFITGFVMEIKGQEYKAYVREKEEAKREYDAAVIVGQSAAHVSVSARDSNRFNVSMNVEPLSKVTFTLTYEQLLTRKHGQYELVVNLNPGQIVKQLTVDVYINETRRILSVDTPALRSGNEIQQTDKATKNEFATVETLNTEGTNVHVNFSPTKQQQQQMASELNPKQDNNGLTGQFTVVYDVERDPQGGEVLISDGYFVHFFAPSDLKPLPKHVIFVLDVSGSMAGPKLDQLKQAMKTILADLSEEDFFDIIKFSSGVQVLNTNYSWDHVYIPSDYEHPSTLSVTPENIAKAQEVIKNLRDEDMTNIYDALQVALKMSAAGASRTKSTNDASNPQPIIIFLTDGQANEGISRSDEIIKMVTSRNENAAVFTLGFGNYVDQNLLKKLALKNHGFMRHIYVAGDAALQLERFYKEISSPLLTDVKFLYTDEQVTSVTKPRFPIMFRGSELVVAGKIKANFDNMVTVEGKTRNGTNMFRPHIYPISATTTENKEYRNLERLWAYLTIKQLLDKKDEDESETNNGNNTSPQKRALNLALQYSFVTPVTSLVVVKPNASEAVEAEEATPGNKNTGRLLSAHVQTASYIPRSYSGARSHFMLSPRRAGSGGGLSHVSYPASVHYDSLRISGSSTNMHTISLPSSMSKSSEVFYDDTDDTTTASIKTLIDYLPWLAPYYSNDQIIIDNKVYTVGNNQTTVEQKQCKVESLGATGNCTLLSVCPMIYSSLDSFDTYKKYFCTLSDTYAGVCCVTVT